MPDKNKILVTTAIDYVNDVIHIGHAYQKILADSVARFYRMNPDNEVFFLTGTDEHGSKSEEAAAAKGLSPKEFVDEISAQDKEQLDSLNISYDRFIRTTDKDHYEVVEGFYSKADQSGDIYLDEYSGIYCVGCEEFKKEKDLTEDGKCPNHPTKDITTVTEQNYFFKWSNYSNFLTDWIKSNDDVVQHNARRNEMLSFLKQGLEDIPISRPNVKFGIPVPGDEKHVLYVWFDALINYITGAPDFWTEESKIIHILGKDNVRWHALLWPAMLLSAGYRLPSVVYGHDFFTIGGQKISKSLGNIIRPTELVDRFGADPVRYFFLRYGPVKDDVDVTIESLTEIYNADLANGLGNLVARVAKMAEKSGLVFELEPIDTNSVLIEYFENFRTDLALEYIWGKIHELDRYVDHNRVWEIQDESEKKEKLGYLVQSIYEIGALLEPFVPDTSKVILEQFSVGSVSSQKPLFQRIRE